MMDLAVDICTVFYRDVLVDNITFDVAARYDRYVDAANRAYDTATYENVLGSDLAMYDALNVNDHSAGTNIAVDGSIDLQLPAGEKIALDHHIAGDD